MEEENSLVKRLGCLGLALLANASLSYLKPFQCAIVVYNRTHDEAEAKRYGITFASKEEILQTCDILSIHLPLTPQTHGMFSTKEFMMMRKDAFIINTTHGGIIDEGALKIALKMGEIVGAALEVFAQEPVEYKELIALDNLILVEIHKRVS